MRKKIIVLFVLCFTLTGCGRLAANPESSSTAITPVALLPTEAEATPTPTVAPTEPEATPTTTVAPTEPEATPTVMANPIECKDGIDVTPYGIKIMHGTDYQNQTLYIYLNDKEGWKADFNAQGMFKEDITLYKTEDGGSNWTKLTSTFDEAATIPLASKSGMIFIDSKNGWLTTETPQEGYIGLYKTSDGGVTWEQQQLEIPEEYIHDMFNTSAPVFFTPTDGILLTYSFGNGSNEQITGLVYVTHDGGNTWTSVKENEDNIFQWSLPGNYQQDNPNSWSIIYNNQTWTTNNMLTWKSK